MRSFRNWLALILTLTVAVASCGCAAAEQEVRRMETAADADEWISAFLGGNPEQLEGVWLLTDAMNAAAAQLGGIGGLAKQLASLGTIEEIGAAYEGEISGYKAFFVPCIFSGMSVDLILVTQDGAIAGLNTGVYTGGREKTVSSEAYDETELTLPVPSLGELPGVLTVPKGEGPFPAVILLHGSGPSDMDETIGGMKPFRDIARELAGRGIAVYRFDKRTYVYGAALDADTRFTPEDEYFEDAVSAVQLVARQEKIDPDRIFVLGHSLGGQMIPALARELEQAPARARGYIMMAAPTRSMDELMRAQVDYLYSLMPEVTEEQQAEREALFAELERLKAPDALSETDFVAGAYAPYWKWLAAYDAVETAREIREPVLLLQGEEDYQVTMEEDFAVWQEAFADRENWRMISYPGLIHTFTPGLKTEGAEAYARAEHVQENVIEDIASFIRAVEEAE